MSSLNLATLSVIQLKGVGTQLQSKLAKLNIHSIQDLLLHLPFRYIDRTRITPIGSVRPAGEVVIEGAVRVCDVSYGRRRSLICRIEDNTGLITLRFFHFSSAQKNQLTPGSQIRCYGEIRRGTSGLEMYHPEYDFLEQAHPKPLEQSLTSVYPAVEGLSQTRLRTLIKQALVLLQNSTLPELLPTALLQNQQLQSIEETLQLIHQPAPDARTDLLNEFKHPVQQRLIVEELLAHHLSLLELRNKHQRLSAPAIPRHDYSTTLKLPFSLTDAQQRVTEEIQTELARPFPMLRLLQGDVGSGKTLVAAIAALSVIQAGYQVAIMAPTEILAEQLKNNLQDWFSALNIKIIFLTGSIKGKGRKALLGMIEDGRASLIIGTHALFQDEVIYHNLGLTIIDEQHRFGVHQRLTLSAKGKTDSFTPHQLIMTATPIPRTLAMSVYADLDCSIIDQLPPGRKPVNTVLINSLRRDDVIQRIQQACNSGTQCYWVCTLIEESDVLEAQAAEATASTLQLALPNLNVGLIHGKLKPAEKNAVMAAFKANELQLLVATTVIEVGVDVPNSNLMIIENPERLGLAQLHQLRGRVGRGSAESHCVLLYQDPLSKTAKQRLTVLRESNDGFKIAAKDLEIRGPGEVLGTRQTGEMVLKVADLQRDQHLLPLVQQTAAEVLASDPATSQQLILRWLGEKTRYAQA